MSFTSFAIDTAWIGVRVLKLSQSRVEYKRDRLARLSGYLLQVSPGEERIVTGTTARPVSNFMGFDGVGMYLIPA